MQWSGSGSEEGIVEHTGQRQVYTIGINPVACGKRYKQVET